MIALEICIHQSVPQGSILGLILFVVSIDVMDNNEMRR